MRKYRASIARMRERKEFALTVKSRALTRDNIAWLRDCFKKLIRRSLWTARGGVYNIEVGDVDPLDMTFNIHIHGLLDGAFIPQDKLSVAWSEITGGSPVVWIADARDSRAGVDYLTKDIGYLVKGLDDAFGVPSVDLTDDLRALVNEVLHGTRVFQSFGDIGLVREAPSSPHCPFCGEMATIRCLDFMDSFRGFSGPFEAWKAEAPIRIARAMKNAMRSSHSRYFVRRGIGITNSVKCPVCGLMVETWALELHRMNEICMRAS